VADFRDFRSAAVPMLHLRAPSFAGVTFLVSTKLPPGVPVVADYWFQGEDAVTSPVFKPKEHLTPCILEVLGYPMANYLVDFYSLDGVLFQSERIVAQDDDDAQGKAWILADEAHPASYKITRLEVSGNTVIRGPKPVTLSKPTRWRRSRRAS
jgi:hypothetical protein